MNERHLPSIEILSKYMKKSGNDVEYAGISSSDDFSYYENVIKFKYKFVCASRQLTKLCKFICTYRSDFNYDWYIKIRPDVQLLQQIDFSNCDIESINARAREYEGPKTIQYGVSTPNDPRKYNVHMHVTEKTYVFNKTEKKVILDDQIFIFHHKIIDKFEYASIPKSLEIEWNHAEHWKRLNITSNVIGINLFFLPRNWTSGDLFL